MSANAEQEEDNDRQWQIIDNDSSQDFRVACACIVELLKASAQKRDLCKGTRVHADIVRRGLIGKSPYVASALLSMYAKCGTLVAAQHVLDTLPIRDVYCWTTLIAGYAQQGQGEEALNCFERMQHEGPLPNAATFVCLLKACASVEAAKQGQLIHDEIVVQGLLQENAMLGTALVDMYLKCGAVAKAQEVFNELPIHDVVSWSALITGYAQQGQGEEALACYENMLHEGHNPNAVTFVSVMKACGSIGAADKGRKICGQLVFQGLLQKSSALGIALVDMFAKCGAFTEAQQVLDELHVRDVVSWSALIAGYVQHGEGNEALNCFEQMQHEGVAPNVITFPSILKACGSGGEFEKGRQTHEKIVAQGLHGSLVVGNALIDMYVKCGETVQAQEVMDELPVRDVVSWSALMAGYAEQGHGEAVLKCLEQLQHEGLSPNKVTLLCILKACGSLGSDSKGKQIYDEFVSKGALEKDIVLDTALVDMYAKCGAVIHAQHVFNDFPTWNIISWSALISGYIEQGEVEEAFICFGRMCREGPSPNEVTFICILKVCGSIGALDKGKQIHDQIVGQGLLEKSIELGNALVDMYAKCGALAEARHVLDKLPVHNVVTWTALIAGYAKQGEDEEALFCFEQMQCDGISPNKITFMCILKACGNIGANDKGKQMHDEIFKQGLLEGDIFLGTALMYMYARCGAFTEAQQVLDEITVRDTTSWNVLIAGYAEHLQGKEALKCFEQMLFEGLSPGPITFTCVLNACSRSGLVDEGQMCLAIINKTFGVTPNLVHFTCIVDLFGRAGHFESAISILKKLPCFGDLPVWSALLGACQKWGNVKVGEWAFEQSLRVDKNAAAAYVSMASMYAAAGMDKDRDKIVAMRYKILT